MAGRNSTGMFRSFTYEKTVEEIKVAMKAKIEQLQAKMAERKTRISRVREEFSITDSELIDLLTQAANQAVSNRMVQSMSYSISQGGAEERLIGAGTVQNLITEKTLIEEEAASVAQLERIRRNLRPVTVFNADGTTYQDNTVSLNESELDFLGL